MRGAGFSLAVMLVMNGHVLWADQHEQVRVRAIDDDAAQIMADGRARSSSFCTLMTAVGRSDLIVYVGTTRGLRSRIGGGIRFLTATAQARFLHVVVSAQLRPKRAVATLAHELRHALEVARILDIRTTDGFSRHFQDHGVPAGRGFQRCTAAARETEEQVLRELKEEPAVAACLPLPQSSIASR